MKKFILLYCVLISSITFGQELKAKEKHSKMLDFVSKTGTIIKFEDYKLENIKLSYGMAESKVRKIIAGQEIQYFFQISKTGKYDTKTASIAYEDIMEIQKALNSLVTQSEIDINSTSDYLENKFITEDGFQVGYFVNNNKIKWYSVLEKYGSDNTIFIKDYETLESTFQAGKDKIDELKNK